MQPTDGHSLVVGNVRRYTSHLATPATDGFALEGMRCVARSLLRAYTDGTDIAARSDMAVASTFGGLALANAKLARGWRAIDVFMFPFLFLPRSRLLSDRGPIGPPKVPFVGTSVGERRALWSWSLFFSVTI